VTTDAAPTPSPPPPPEPFLPAPPLPSRPQPPRPGSGITLLRVVGSIVAALVVAGTTVSVVSRFFHQHRVETAVYSQTLTGMSIRTTTGDVRVAVGEPGSPVVVRRVLDWSFGTAGSAETVTDGRLDIAARCSIRLGVGSCSVDYEVTVPPNLAVRLDSDTGDVGATGPVGDVAASTDTGDVRIQGATSARIDASASTGDVQVELASPPRDVAAHSSTGDVLVVLPADGTSYDVRTSTPTGDATVTVPTAPGADRRIDASTSTGDVVVRAAS
jgi:Putative adhesin